MMSVARAATTGPYGSLCVGDLRPQARGRCGPPDLLPVGAAATLRNVQGALGPRGKAEIVLRGNAQAATKPGFQHRWECAGHGKDRFPETLHL